jgi:calcium-dependent protein kinase
MLERGMLNEREAAYLLKRILLAVNVLHENGIAHRDLKPENFLFETHKLIELKLIDLGLSQRYRTSAGSVVGMHAIVGTPIYTAPEIFSEGVYGPKCDLWSIGVIMWRMLVGKKPFAGDSEEELAANIVAGTIDYEPTIWASLST